MSLAAEANQARKYVGPVAENYEAKRKGEEKWAAENRIVENWLFDLEPNTVVLDCPVGTGRFFPIYEKYQFSVLGVDVSDDMLAQSRAKKSPNVSLHKGSILTLGLSDKSVDVALAIRVFHLLIEADVIHALCELQRIAISRIIFNVRVKDHARVRGYDLIQTALGLHKYGLNLPTPKGVFSLPPGAGPPWKIGRDEQIIDTYRMIELEPDVG